MSNHNNFASFRNNLISKNNPLEPIFVPTFRQTMEQNYQLSLKQNKHHQKKSSLSFCEYSQKTSNIQIYKNTFFIKQDIKPHQNKPLKLKISELIKSSLAHCKTLANIQQKSQIQSASITKNKKSTSYSAYINSHKKLLQKKNSLNSNVQKQSSFISLKLSSNTQKTKEQKVQVKAEQILEGDKLESVKEKKEICIVEAEIKENKQKYLQRLILKNKKSQAARRQRHNMFSPKFEGEFKAEALKNGFLKLVRKRKNEPSLVVNSKKKNLKHAIKEQKQDSIQKVYKRFADQKCSNEEDLQFIIKKQGLKIEQMQLENNISQQLFSKAVTILQIKQGQINSLLSLNQKTKLQIASVTKIMTCYLILVLCQNFSLDLKKQKVIISQKASKMQGTSAKLSYSDVVTIYDLLHGLMLPSGNDAAIALGEWGGKIIRKYTSILRRQQSSLSPPKIQKSLNVLTIKRKSNLKLFIYHMNKLAKQLHLTQTFFVNTHGLMNDKAYSCSEDVSVLSYYSMKNTIFREIVRKTDYSCKIYNRTFSSIKDFIWNNTNKLLSVQGFIGTKTGVTPSAGPCLTSMFQLKPDHYFIVTILHTKSCEMRFRETIKLLESIFEVLKVNKDQRQLFQNAISNLQLYDKDESKEDEGQMLNNMLQSTSQSDKDQDQQMWIPKINSQNQTYFIK